MQVIVQLQDPAVLSRCGMMEVAVALSVKIGEGMEHVSVGIQDELFVFIRRGENSEHFCLFPSMETVGTALVIDCRIKRRGSEARPVKTLATRDTWLYLASGKDGAIARIHQAYQHGRPAEDGESIPVGTKADVTQLLADKLTAHFRQYALEELQSAQAET